MYNGLVEGKGPDRTISKRFFFYEAAGLLSVASWYTARSANNSRKVRLPPYLYTFV